MTILYFILTLLNFSFLEFSFGDHLQSCGVLTNGSPNYKDFRLSSESVWKDAVEYSSINITMEQCLFQNVECFVTENSQLSSGPVCLDLDGNLPESTTQQECMTQNFGETTDPAQQDHNLSEKRVRNNKACKKFRKARKSRHEQLYIMEEKMLKENYFLKHRVSALEKEIEKWKEFFGSQK
jgi:hypothetical protein